MAKHGKKKSGLRVGGLVIRPAGLAVIAVLIILIAVLVVLLVSRNGDTTQIVNAVTPTPEVTETPEVEATPTPVPTPIPTATPKPEPRSATIRSLGEIALDDAILASAKVSGNEFNFDAMFAPVADLIGNADYTVATVEGAISGNGGYSGTKDKYIAPASILSTLSDCGVDMIAIANDHMLDAGFDGIGTTIGTVSGAGLDYVGGGTSTDDTMPIIKTVNGINIGFVCYTDSLNGKEKKQDKTKLQYLAHYANTKNFASDIRNAKIAGANVVIAYMNWGEIGSSKPTSDQKKMAEELAKAGADVIIGYNPMTVQPMEWIEGTEDGVNYKALCLYATGSMLSAQTDNHCNTGVILNFTIQEQEDGTFDIEDVSYIPTYVLHTENTAEVVAGAADEPETDDTADEEDIPADDTDEEELPANDEDAMDEEEIPVDDEEPVDDEDIPADDEDITDEDTADDEAADDEDSEDKAPAKEESTITANTKYLYRVINTADWLADDASLHLQYGMTTEDLDNIIGAWAYAQRVIGLTAGSPAKE